MSDIDLDASDDEENVAKLTKSTKRCFQEDSLRKIGLDVDIDDEDEENTNTNRVVSQTSSKKSTVTARQAKEKWKEAWKEGTKVEKGLYGCRASRFWGRIRARPPPDDSLLEQ